jgi:nicotinamide riboside kinase
VKESVRKINELQHKYCQLKDQYEERYRQVEKAVRKYEFRVGEAVAKNQEYVRRANELSWL